MSRPRPSPLNLEPMQMATNTPIHSSRFNWTRPSRLLKSLSCRNWRRAAIALAILSTLRFAVRANISFHDADTDTTFKMYRLSRLSLISAALYTISTFIEIFGVFACIKQERSLVRTYVFFAFLAAVLVSVASLVSTAGFFKYKDTLVDQCVQMLHTGMDLSEKSTFKHVSLSKTAEKSLSHYHTVCLSSWTSAAPSQVPSLIFFHFVPSVFIFLFPYLFYGQLVDPNARPSTASVYEPVHAQTAMRTHESTYSSGSRRSAVSLHRVGQLPGYARSARVGRPGHLAVNVDWTRTGTGSPVSPGPPSYDGERRRGYANWFSHGAEYERL